MKIPSQFSVVKQPPGSRVCGAACCAMAVGKSLDQILRDYDWRELTHTTGIAKVLADHGITMGLHLTGDDCLNHIRLSVDPAGHPAIVAVAGDMHPHVDHWVFWDGQQILDPNSHPLGEYRTLEVHYLSYWERPEWIDDIDSAFPQK